MELPAGARWLDWWAPEAGPILTWPGTTASELLLSETDDSITTIGALYEPRGLRSEVTLSRAVRPTILRIYREMADDTALVRANGRSLLRHPDRAAFDAADEGYLIEAPFVWVKLPASSEALTVEALPAL